MSRRAMAAPPEIEGFRYVEPLGAGGFADVHKYEQLGLHRPVAVKVLLRGLPQAAQASFEAEANQMAQLSNHPSIVSIYQAGAAPDGRPYLVMEYCPPPGLYAKLQQRPYTVSKALEITIQIAGAVETAHHLGILHRDIKPANILFTEFGRPALTDFGIAMTTGEAATGNAGGVSVPWAPPEQLTGESMSFASDVYSLAATCYTMLAGHSPFELSGGPNDPWSMAPRVKRDPLPPLDREDCPASLERVLQTAMAKNPLHRYPTALEFARALQAIQAETHQGVTPMDVRLDASFDDDDDSMDAGDGETRFSGFVPIDPEPAPPRPITVPTSVPSATSASGMNTQTSTFGASTGDLRRLAPMAPGANESYGETIVVGRGDGSTMTEPPIPARSPFPWRLVLLVVGSLLTIGLIIWGVSSLGSRQTVVSATTPSQSKKPVDPLPPAAPPVADLKLTAAGGKVTATWRNTAPQTGDSYYYRVVDPTKETAMQTTKETKVTVTAEKGRTCVEVVLVRSNGKSSEPKVECVPS